MVEGPWVRMKVSKLSPHDTGTGSPGRSPTNVMSAFEVTP